MDQKKGYLTSEQKQSLLKLIISELRILVKDHNMEYTVNLKKEVERLKTTPEMKLYNWAIDIIESFTDQFVVNTIKTHYNNMLVKKAKEHNSQLVYLPDVSDTNGYGLGKTQYEYMKQVLDITKINSDNIEKFKENFVNQMFQLYLAKVIYDKNH